MDIDTLRMALEQPAVVEVAGAARDAAGWTFDEGPLGLEVKRGVLVPLQVRVGELHAPAGWVFVGEAEGRARWPDLGAARRFAVRQVLTLGAARDRMASVASNGPLVTAVDRALLLQPGQGGAEGLPFAPSADVAEATAALRDRVQQLDGVIDVGRWLPHQALLVANGMSTVESSTAWLDLRTADRFGVVRSPESPGAAPEDRWLAMARDDSGAWLDEGRCRRLYAAGRDTLGGRHARSLGDFDCTEGPPVTLVRTEVTLTARPAKDDYNLHVSADMRLVVRANRPVRTFALDVSFLNDAIDGTGVLGPIRTADGARVDLPFRRDPADRGPPDTVLVVLPEPLAAGASTTLSVHADDTWAFGVPGRIGRSTWPESPYPRVPGAPRGITGEGVMRVGVPTGVDLDVAMPGPARTWEADGLAWSEWAQPGGQSQLAVSIGRWASIREAAIPSADPAQKQPAVAVYMSADEDRALAGVLGFSRPVIAWLNTVLPPFPPDALTVFQAPDGFLGYTWIAPEGMVSLQQARKPDWAGAGDFQKLEHSAEGTYAHELAHQYWGNEVVPARYEQDQWIAETLAEVYADLFAGAMWGSRAYEARRDLHRRICEQDLARHTGVALSAPEARNVALYDCGPYLFEHVLRERIGVDALLGALDTFARTHAGRQVRGDELLAAIQADTQVDLRDFWDAWIHVGYIPALAGTWTSEPDGSLSGTIAADVPFVTYDVPVRVSRGGRAETVWCKVTDGAGSWTLPPGPKVDRVDLDPHGMLLARERKMRAVRR